VQLGKTIRANGLQTLDGNVKQDKGSLGRPVLCFTQRSSVLKPGARALAMITVQTRLDKAETPRKECSFLRKEMEKG
jgi:hypothetical protein